MDSPDVRPHPHAVRSKATFSHIAYDVPENRVEDAKHRFWLERWYGTIRPPQRPLTWLLCNGSTASRYWNDATLNKCERLTLEWGYDGMIIVNAFSFRGRHFDQAVLNASTEADERNWQAIKLAVESSEKVICGWSQWAKHFNRHDDLLKFLEPYDHLYYLKLGKGDIPAHPLYLSLALQPTHWTHR